jgi:hypothetical protein
MSSAPATATRAPRLVRVSHRAGAGTTGRHQPGNLDRGAVEEVSAVDGAGGTVTVHVVTVENLAGDQSEDDFDGDDVTFILGPSATFEDKPDRNGDGAGNLADIAVDDLAKVDVEANDRLPVGTAPLTAVFIDSRAP